MQNVLKKTCTDIRADSGFGILFLVFFSHMTFFFLKGYV